MAYHFAGKCALVTGASRGIGKEVALQLLRYGASVYALSSNRENLAALKSELPQVGILCADVGNWTEVRNAVSGIGVVDLLVNNAGMFKSVPFEEIIEETFDRIYNVNVKPIINISQVVVEKLKANGKEGSIVNVSSMTSRKYMPNGIVYGSSKAALEKITQYMATELAPFKIRVNSVSPTFVDTQMLKNLFERLGKEKVKKMIPLGEICTSEDVTNSILFLLSDQSKMITGVNLPIDGGQLFA